MRFTDKIKMFFSPRFDEVIRQYLSGEETKTTLDPISEQSAFNYSVVFACFRVLAETFASVPIFEYKKSKNGDREQTDQTGIYDILHGVANEEMSSYNWKESSMYQQCAGGNSVSVRILNSTGGTVGLSPIEWQRVRIERDKETGKIIYIIDSDTNKKYSRSEVLHVPGPSTNGIIGMSILEYAANSIRLGSSYERFGINFYKNGCMNSGIFKHPTDLKDQAYERLKEDLSKSYQGLANVGKPLILEGGMDFKELTIKPVDAQMLESRKFQIEELCRFCRVPLHLVQNLDKATNNNIEHQSLEFAMYTMLPHFKRYEECINTQLLTKKQRSEGYYFEFNMNALLRGDAASMASAFAIGRQWGWLSVNDIRRMLNLNSIPNGDIYLTPMNMIEAGKDPYPEASPIPTEKNSEVDQKVKEEIDNLMTIAKGRI